MSIKNAKAKGTRNEHRSRVILEQRGYKVTRAAGSMGEWDLVGMNRWGVIVVQCKTRDWPSAREMAVLRAFEVPACCGKKEVHRWRDGHGVPDVRHVV